MHRRTKRNEGSSVRDRARRLGTVVILIAASTVSEASAQATPPSEAALAAAALMSAGEWEQAAEAYRGVVADEPENGLAWLRLGRAYVEMGQPDDALLAFAEVPGTGLQTPFLNVFEARAYAQLGRDDDAFAALEAVQPVPGLGGAAALTGFEELAIYAGTARFDAITEAFEAAAWPCRADSASREFDFWIGDWDVYVSGSLAGRNTVELMLGDCTLLENWTSAGNREGKSFNWVDRSTYRTPRWRQLWVADGGNTLDYYNGEYRDGAMRFEGHIFSPTGDSIPQKLRFENIAPDTVRQVFEQSTDDGATWVVTFDGLYIRRDNRDNEGN